MTAGIEFSDVGRRPPYSADAVSRGLCVEAPPRRGGVAVSRNAACHREGADGAGQPRLTLDSNSAILLPDVHRLA
jgi:hypothetical protein